MAFTFIEAKKGGITRRQDAPKVFEVNGVLYIISVDALFKYKSFHEFLSVKKCLMRKEISIDIDTVEDWKGGAII